MLNGSGTETPSDPPNRLVVRLGLALAAAALAVRLLFWAYTGRIWEDALITLAHSENAVRGIGLTLPQGGGRPVQGFSSPLGVLLPLAGDFVSLGSGLTVLRVASALAGGLTVLYLLRIALHPSIRLSTPAAILAMGYAAFEHHQISWGMAGMETQLATLALVASIYYLVAGNAYALGLALGVCVLARPEFALWAVAAGLVVLERNRRDFLVAAGAGFGLYLPWLAFSWAYYGSPIPNTILAKGLGYPLWWKDTALNVAAASKHLAARLSCAYLPDSIFQALGPSFAGHGTHFSRIFNDHGAVCLAALFLVLVGCGMAVYHRRRGMIPPLVFAAVFTAYLTFAVPHVFGWYAVPFAAVLVLMAAYGLDSVADLIPNRRARTAFAYGLVAAYLALMIGMLPRTFNAEKRIQQDIENAVRKPACEYLARAMYPGQTLGCEALGHTAYSVRRQVFDWPGLASRKVVQYSRENPGGRSLEAMLEALRPDWLLLRPFEYERAKKTGNWIDQDYALVRQFKSLDCAHDIMLASRNIDFEFWVFRKKS
ncbi:MAG TPA: hypothetical protein VMZ06_11780 [Candidatus Bathyarchaeia archaeon]|nr:hypothetical protein [Candidatus Bathyarchaeia archaeon]